MDETMLLPESVTDATNVRIPSLIKILTSARVESSMYSITVESTVNE